MPPRCGNWWRNQLEVEQWQRALEIGGCEESLREVWQSQPQLWDNNLSIARGGVSCSYSRWRKCSRRSRERHTFTSSIINSALLKTMLTATDSTHRCIRLPWQFKVIHGHFFGLQGTQWMQNSVRAFRVRQRVAKHHHGPHREQPFDCVR